jgi:hypothetical protein
MGVNHPNLKSVPTGHKPAPSPARQRLDQHREQIAAAQRKVEEAERPVRNAQAGLDMAESEMRTAAAAVASADELEREALILAAQSTSGKDPTGPARGADRSRAEEKLRTAQHRVGLHREVIAKVKQPHDDAARALAALMEGTGAFASQAKLEEFECIAVAFDGALAAPLQHELTLRSIAAACSVRGRQLADSGRVDLAKPWFAVAEKMGEHLLALRRYEGPQPRDVFEGEARHLAEIAKLEA